MKKAMLKAMKNEMQKRHYEFTKSPGACRFVKWQGRKALRAVDRAHERMAMEAFGK